MDFYEYVKEAIAIVNAEHLKTNGTHLTTLQHKDIVIKKSCPSSFRHISTIRPIGMHL